MKLSPELRPQARTSSPEVKIYYFHIFVFFIFKNLIFIFQQEISGKINYESFSLNCDYDEISKRTWPITSKKSGVPGGGTA